MTCLIDSAPATTGSNPFGDADSDGDEQASQGSGSVPRSGVENVMSVPARVMYAYKAEEEDEISAEAGTISTRYTHDSGP